MSKERRYNEKEIAAIFEQAAKDFDAAQQQMQASDGLTLREIEEIAKEAGISAAFVKRAASKVDLRSDSPPVKKLFGLPTQVNRVVELPNNFGDEDWDQLIVAFHDAYGMIGTVKEQRDGRIRSWITDKVQVYLEPTGTGSRLRVISMNGPDTLMFLFGSIFFFVSMMFMAIIISKGKFMTEMDDTMLMFILTALGLGVGGFGASRMPKWYKNEEQRIDGILSRTVESQRSDAEIVQEDAINSPLIDLDDVAGREESRALSRNKDQIKER